MEALIPKLFILTAEASIVLFLILIAIFIFNSKAKRKDLKAVNELITNYTGTKEERISALSKQLQNMAFKGDVNEHAEQLFQQEKSVIKEFVSLYLQRDTYRLLDYPDALIETNDIFLKTTGAGIATTLTSAPEDLENTQTENTEEQTANATILAREQAESNEEHLKELSELRLKNTELNEHLFEALETITALMTEHGKKTGQEVESNAQKILDAIIYLRDKRLSQADPSQLAPPITDDNDQVDSFNLDDEFDHDNSVALLSVNLADDATLDDSPEVNLGLSEELNVDLNSINNTDSSPDDANVINLEDPLTEKSNTLEEEDPWAEALNEQAATETQSNTEADPWAGALAEQASAETDNNSTTEEEGDPWADALAEQATAEANAEETMSAVSSAPQEQEAEDDPWADALAEQASAEATQDTEADSDPWAEALAEQEKADKQ